MRLTATFVAVLFILGCGEQPQEVDISSDKVPPISEQQVLPAREIDRTPQSLWETIPENQKLPAVNKVVISNSWQDRIDQLSGRERKYLSEVNNRYFGSLDFKSPDEQSKQILLGYPTPEEWLAAQEMTSFELEGLAEAGNKKAQILYADRLSAEFDRAKVANGDESMSPGQLKTGLDATKYSSMALRGSKNPFAAYLYGSVEERRSGVPETAAAGILLAKQLGDADADRYALDLSKQYPSMNPATVQVIFGSMKKIAGLTSI